MGISLVDLFELSLLDEMIADGFVRRFEHDNGDLVGYNYSERAQWDRVWNEVTLQCRGLIADTSGNVLARPFRKFFNLGEDPTTDGLYERQGFELFEKLDGSLGILFEWDGKHHITTKGSFHSEQAAWATNEIRRVVAPTDTDEVTYLFEIIFPENRIIVDYGDRHELSLLDALSIDDGSRVERTWPAMARTFDVPAGAIPAEIRDSFAELDDGNFEGFVAVFPDGHRVKIKLATYVRLHRILSATSSKSVWESLMAGDDPADFGEVLPDEFHRWVKAQIEGFTASYAAIEQEHTERFEQISHLLSDRRAFAAEATKSGNARLLFSMADGKDYSETIWKMLRPAEIEYPPSHI